MVTKKPRIIAFMNAYSQGKSGGDMVFIEIAKRIKEYDKIIVTSLLGKDLCQKSGLRGKYLITTSELEFRNVILTYFKRTLKALFLKFKIREKDIFLGTSDFLPDVLPIFWLKMKKKKAKWVQHIFHLIPSSRLIPFFAQKLSLLLIKRFADLIIVDNSFLRNDLVKLGFAPRKIFINYPGIDLKYLKSVRPKTSAKYDGIFMAQLRQSKGIFDLIRIWRLVCKRKPGARLGIIGKGDKKIIRKMKREIKFASMGGNINLLGYLENDRAFSTIKASKIFVFPSHEEGFGIAPLEAQALGLPVVAWNLPVFKEVFKKGMVKVDVGNLKRFADEVIRVLTDKRFYQELSEKAINNASQYDWCKVARRELELILIKRVVN